MYKRTSPLIVIRSSDICFTGILRSCKLAGIKTIAITFDWDGAPDWLSEHSSCLEERYQIANPFTHATLAAQQFLELLKGFHRVYGHKLMVLPSSDTNLMFLLDHFHIFEPYMLMMGSADFQLCRSDLVHKGQCASLLSAELPQMVPATAWVKHAEDIPGLAQQMRFPLIYKPAVKDYGQSFYASHKGMKAIECDSRETLEQALQKDIDAGFELVVQEKILFDSVYNEIPFYLYVDSSGRITMAANGLKTVIDPFPFGTAIVLDFAWYPELLELAQQVVDATGYRGILMIEFIQDQADGKWKVIELNTRHWLFNGFYQRLGFNFTLALFNDLCGETATPVTTDYVKGASTVGVHIDITAIARYLHSRQGALGMDELLGYLEGLGDATSTTFYHPEDSLPGEIEIGRLAETFQWDRDRLMRGVLSKLADY